MDLTIKRFLQTPDWTLGYIPLDLGRVFTLERGWRNNERFVSCIPDGEFILEPHVGAVYRDTYAVCDEDGDITHFKTEECTRYGILFHPANHPHELSGCIAPALQLDFNELTPAGWRSREALSRLVHFIKTKNIKTLVIENRF